LLFRFFERRKNNNLELDTPAAFGFAVFKDLVRRALRFGLEPFQRTRL
jgi:hypothetical protein